MAAGSTSGHWFSIGGEFSLLQAEEKEGEFTTFHHLGLLSGAGPSREMYEMGFYGILARISFETSLVFG